MLYCSSKFVTSRLYTLLRSCKLQNDVKKSENDAESSISIRKNLFWHEKIKEYAVKTHSDVKKSENDAESSIFIRKNLF